MADKFSVPPWRMDGPRIRSGETVVATLNSGVPWTEFLAAAPDLLLALEPAKVCLEKLFGATSFLPVVPARNNAETAIAHARVGYSDAERPLAARCWKINDSLPRAEWEANERLLDAAPELLKAVGEALGFGGNMDSEVKRALEAAFTRAHT